MHSRATAAAEGPSGLPLLPNGAGQPHGLLTESGGSGKPRRAGEIIVAARGWNSNEGEADGEILFLVAWGIYGPYDPG
jgi:hypothetical protein